VHNSLRKYMSETYGWIGRKGIWEWPIQNIA